jgi:hypothetical protein
MEVLDVLAPAERVAGAPGRLSIQQTSCRTTPAAEVRRRVVDVAVQEWGFFGFTVIDQTVPTDHDGNNARRFPRRRPNPAETARTAADIAGYWTVTPEGAWIIENQNEIWNGPRGVGERWRTPWSAAFISWVMCESGFGDSNQFQRAIAHHSFIDQAIRTRDQGVAGPAFAAYDVDEAAVEPGDLLCTARRPEYRTLAERRRQMGEGARTHCDVVVKVDDAGGRIMAIGGNVRGTVSLKILPAAQMDGGLRATTASGRSVFAHLKLRASPIEYDALDHSPTIRALGCADTTAIPVTFATASLVAAGTLLCAD